MKIILDWTNIDLFKEYSSLAKSDMLKEYSGWANCSLLKEYMSWVKSGFLEEYSFFFSHFPYLDPQFLCYFECVVLGVNMGTLWVKLCYIGRTEFYKFFHEGFIKCLVYFKWINHIIKTTNRASTTKNNN